MEEIIVVLDKSGSMQAVANDAKEGYNAFLKEQQEIGEANLTVIYFDNGFNVEYEGKLANAKPLKSWPNGGSTALFDAIGKAFNHVKDRFSKEKPEKVIMAIQTDGEENSSREFTSEVVAGLIKEHEDKYGWNVIFLSAGLDAANTAVALNIKAANTFAYDANKTRDAMGLYSSTVASYRS